MLKKFGDVAKGDVKKNPFKIAEYRETYEATTEIIQDDDGIMMEEKDYIQYQMGKNVDPLSPVDAAAAWAKMAATLGEHFHDKKGQGGAYRFRVSLADKVIFRSSFKQSRKVELHGKTVKNPGGDAIQKMKHLVPNGQSTTGDDTQELNAMAKAMLLAGNGMQEDGSFDGSFMLGNIRNIRKLAEDETEDEAVADMPEGKKDQKGDADADHDDGSSTFGAGSFSSAPQARQKKEKGRDAVAMSDEIAKAQRVRRKACTMLTNNFNEKMPACDAALLQALPNADNMHLKTAYQLCTNRTDFAKAIMADTSHRLETLLDAVDNPWKPEKAAMKLPDAVDNPGKPEKAASEAGSPQMLSWDDFAKLYAPPWHGGGPQHGEELVGEDVRGCGRRP